MLRFDTTDSATAAKSPLFATDGPDDSEIRLTGDVRGKRVLDLGCGEGQATIAFAKLGAIAIGVDESAERIQRARQAAEREDARIEWQANDASDLAMIRADSIDLVWSAGMLPEIDDIDRLFRQVHRVLKLGAPFVFSYDHPFCLALTSDSTNAGARPYNDENPIITETSRGPVAIFPRMISTVLSSLQRAGFRADAIVEPTDPGATRPKCIIWRARKDS